MILITGASGQLSSQVIKIIKNHDIDILTASRQNTASRIMDFDDPETLDFLGARLLFLTSAGYAEDDVVINRHRNVINAAKRDGVEHIVYTSLSCASDHLAFALAHRWTEDKLMKSGMKWTILRNGLYTELIAALIKPENGVINAPFGKGQISLVPRSDLARAACEVLLNSVVHENKTYELSGTQSISIPQIAAAAGLKYEPTSLSHQREQLAKLEDLLPFQSPMLMSLFSSASAGFLQTQHTDLQKFVANPMSALEHIVELIRG